MTTKRADRRSPRKSRRSSRHGNAPATGWASGKRPSHFEIWAHGKPIEIRKVGSKWGIAVMGHPVCRLPGEGGLTFRGRANFVDGLGAALFSKSDAKFLAHKIGHYMLGLGDLVYTYTEGY